MWNCFCPVCFLRERSIFRVSLKSRYDDGQWEISMEDLGVPPPPRPPCGLLYISALHVQYGIQAFAKFKRPECTRLHLREFQSQKISRRSMRPKLPRKVRRYWQSRWAPYSHFIRYFQAPSITNRPSAPGFCFVSSLISNLLFPQLMEFNEWRRNLGLTVHKLLLDLISTVDSAILCEYSHNTYYALNNPHIKVI